MRCALSSFRISAVGKRFAHRAYFVLLALSFAAGSLPLYKCQMAHSGHAQSEIVAAVDGSIPGHTDGMTHDNSCAFHAGCISNALIGSADVSAALSSYWRWDLPLGTNASGRTTIPAYHPPII